MCTACFGTAAQFLFSWVEVGEAAGLVLESSSPCPRFSACGCKRRTAMLRHSLASVPGFCCGKGFSLQQPLLCFIMSDALSRLCPVLSLHWFSVVRFWLPENPEPGAACAPLYSHIPKRAGALAMRQAAHDQQAEGADTAEAPELWCFTFLYSGFLGSRNTPCLSVSFCRCRS